MVFSNVFYRKIYQQLTQLHGMTHVIFHSIFQITMPPISVNTHNAGIKLEKAKGTIHDAAANMRQVSHGSDIMQLK